MLAQIFGRLFLSQWIVFAVLVILLVGLSEFACFPILIAIVIAIITDIDTPRDGFISLDERPLLDQMKRGVVLSRPQLRDVRWSSGGHTGPRRFR